MKINEYQLHAHGFALYNGEKGWAYPWLGLSEECGELNGKMAKIIRDKDGTMSDEDKQAIMKELGDVCWFVAEIATQMNVSLERVMQMNIDKLESRKARNVIHGSGDDR